MVSGCFLLDKIKENLDHNLARVENLVKTYESHPDAQGQGRKSTEVLDILRAGVVLLHATLEDVLRNIAYWKLPTAPATVLNNIPLVGSGPNPKKFQLGDLEPYRGRTIDDVIREAVHFHLEHSTFNNTNDIACLLQNVGVDVAQVNSTFNDLKDLMEQRHQIVHRADRKTEVSGSGDHEVRGINKHTVRDWAWAVKQFADSLFPLL
jgi:hypothetical protein